MEDGSYPYELKIDGARADEDQHWRIDRIHRILGYAQSLADLDNKSEFCEKLESIYDHKGSLFIGWKTNPSDEEKEYMRKAWESIVTDYESNPIEHSLGDLILSTKP